MNIHSINIGTIKSNTIYSRAAYHIKYFFAGLWKSHGLQKPVIVISSMPSLLVGIQGYLVSKFKRAKLYLDVRDLWTESLSTTSLVKIPMFLTLNKSIEKYL